MTVITHWTDEDRRNFRSGVVRGRHMFAETGLFDDASLARLLDHHPRELAAFCSMDEAGLKDSWVDLDPGQRSGEALLEMVRTGRLWINLQELFDLHAEYKALLDAAVAELRALHPGFDPRWITGQLLISSPSARVPYHIDKTDTLLWHVRGRKRVMVYPKAEPYLTDAMIEMVMHQQYRDDLPYETGHDAGAAVFDLEPGEVLSWPALSPHRVINLGELCVTVATDYVTRDIQLAKHAYFFNGCLRKAGLTPTMPTARGVGFHLRAGLGLVAGKIAAGLRRLAPPPQETPLVAV